MLFRMLAHKFVEQSMGSDNRLKKPKTKKSWWSFGWWKIYLENDSLDSSIIYMYLVMLWCFQWFWFIFRNNQSAEDESEPLHFSEEDWAQLNKIIGYKEVDDGHSLIINEKLDTLHTSLEIHMKHNASKLLDGVLECLAELSCKDLDCSIKLYPETKVFDMKLGSYQLSSPNGLLAEVWFNI